MKTAEERAQEIVSQFLTGHAYVTYPSKGIISYEGFMRLAEAIEAAEAPLLARIKELESYQDFTYKNRCQIAEQKNNDLQIYLENNQNRVHELEELLRVATGALEFYAQRTHWRGDKLLPWDQYNGDEISTSGMLARKTLLRLEKEAAV